MTSTTLNEQVDERGASVCETVHCGGSADRSYKSHQSATTGVADGDDENEDGMSEGAREYEEMMAEFEEQDLNKKEDDTDMGEDIPLPSSQVLSDTPTDYTSPPQAPPPSPIKAQVGSPPEFRLPSPVVPIPRAMKRKVDDVQDLEELDDILFEVQGAENVDMDRACVNSSVKRKVRKLKNDRPECEDRGFKGSMDCAE